VAGALCLLGALRVAGALCLLGALRVAGALCLLGALRVDGALCLLGALRVDGAPCLVGATRVLGEGLDRSLGLAPELGVLRVLGATRALGVPLVAGDVRAPLGRAVAALSVPATRSDGRAVARGEGEAVRVTAPPEGGVLAMAGREEGCAPPLLTLATRPGAAAGVAEGVFAPDRRAAVLDPATPGLSLYEGPMGDSGEGL